MSVAATTDAALARAARDGDRDAFAELYRRYFPPVHDFLVRMTRDRELAADLTQDVFLRAMGRLDQLRDGGRFRAWIFTIARSQALNRLRRERRTVTVDPTTEEGAPVDRFATLADETRFSDPEEAAAAREAAELVWEAAAALDERTRTVLLLSVRHGLESPEIAEVLGVTRGNAAVMVNRSRRRATDAISTYLFVRRGRGECAGLDAIVAAASTFDAATRRRVDRHVAGCRICGERRRRLVAPAAVLAAYAAVAPPAGLEEAIWNEIERRWDREGPPRRTRRRSRLLRGGLLLGLVLLVALATGAAVGLARRAAEAPTGAVPPATVPGTTAAGLLPASGPSVTTSLRSPSTSVVTTAPPPTSTVPPTATTSTSVATTAPPPTSVAPPPPPSTATPAVVACPSQDPFAGQPLERTEVVADLDGDGLPETLTTYLSLQDGLWHVRVAFGRGGALDRAIAGTDRASPARPIGGHDLDGDGVAEVFLTTGSGAATVLVGLYGVRDCTLERIAVTATAVAAAPATFPVGVSTLAVSGVRCPAEGGLERLFATSRDGRSFVGGTQPYRLVDTGLVPGQVTSGTFDAAEAAALGVFDCDGLTLP